MNASGLFRNIQAKKSFLCVGLDSDPKKIPGHLSSHSDPVYEFNKEIIRATHEFAVAYKPNIAFYESQGAKGWETLNKTLTFIRRTDPDMFVIADAKRGDIGNTSGMYARAFFETMDFDAVTVAPYMGSDSVRPFLEYENKWVALLALTSNPGADDFQLIRDAGTGRKVFEIVLETSKSWAGKDQLMYVAGATRAEMLADIRRIIPEHFLLVPGVGAQGGSLEEVCKYGMNKQCGLLVNSSRGIIFADGGPEFGEVAAGKAKEIQTKMAGILEEAGLVPE